MASTVRQNFHQDSEAGLNKHINLELYASNAYLYMAFHFDRADVALPGAHKYFLKISDKKRENAEKLMKYQNERGGRIVLQAVAKPEKDEWDTLKDAMVSSQTLEKSVNQAILDLHKVAETHHDEHMADWLEDNFLLAQVEVIKEIGDHISNLTRAGEGLGEYMFDKETLLEG
ncbi:soma ferritin-like [Amphiura filiformis]|uniref:soma ferritin-like n=1 Tax=Amphiura filiformis TaxID=82378 RepID=UPI003B21763A